MKFRSLSPFILPNAHLLWLEIMLIFSPPPSPLWRMWVSELQEARRCMRSVIFPMSTQRFLMAFTCQSVHCRFTPADLHHAGRQPFLPMTSVVSVPLWRKYPNDGYALSWPAWCREGYLPRSTFCCLLHHWRKETTGFPTSRRRDADHSRLSCHCQDQLKITTAG